MDNTELQELVDKLCLYFTRQDWRRPETVTAADPQGLAAFLRIQAGFRATIAETLPLYEAMEAVIRAIPDEFRVFRVLRSDLLSRVAWVCTDDGELRPSRAVMAAGDDSVLSDTNIPAVRDIVEQALFFALPEWYRRNPYRPVTQQDQRISAYLPGNDLLTVAFILESDHDFRVTIHPSDRASVFAANYNLYVDWTEQRDRLRERIEYYNQEVQALIYAERLTGHSFDVRKLAVVSDVEPYSQGFRFMYKKTVACRYNEARQQYYVANRLAGSTVASFLQAAEGWWQKQAPQ
jgi:hypothetical protein